MEKDFSTANKRGIEIDRIKLTRRRKQILRELGFGEDLKSAEIAEVLKSQVKANDALSRANKDLSKTIKARDKEIKDRDKEIKNRDKEIRSRDIKITKLEQRIAQLEGKLQKPVIKTSANSSVPPSKNPIGIPHTQSLRKPSGRKTGGQQGHEGFTRPISESTDKSVPWYPEAVCPKCGRPLDMEHAVEGAVRQVVDIPLPILASIVNHISMQVKCTCGYCSKGKFPENVNAPVSFGPNIRAFVSYLSTYQNVPFKKMTDILENIFGLHISQGSVSNILNDMRKLSKTPYEMIRKKVANGKVAGADESGVNVNGKNNWLWTFQNKVATYLAFDKGRSHKVVNQVFSKKELGGKVWVTDRLPAYFMEDVGMEDHQVCIAHLLRNLTYTMQTFPDDPWSVDMLDLLRESVHQRNEGNADAELKAGMEGRLDELLARPPVYKNDDGKDTELDTLKKGIAKHKEHIFTFLSNPEVPPTNNDSEKALRPAKTKLKVSGCFRSESGIENYATVGSVIQTAIKNGQNPFKVLQVIAKLAEA